VHKTAASPLAAIYIALIVYASLYPFEGWRDQGVALGAFLLAPFPRYWTVFDVGVNVVGYLPLGGLLALSALRNGHGRHALRFAFLVASLLSLLMETLQSYLPVRVSSREDWLLNSAGALAGAVLVVALERWGLLERWSQVRERWFIPQSRGAMVLLATWPAALLFPPAVPFGLGVVYERLEAALAAQLADSPFLDWLPVRDFELEPLVPLAELACVWLGLLIPCLLGFSVIRTLGQRLQFVVLLMVTAVLAAALSAALSYGPVHAWAWLDAPAQVALVLACLTALPLALLDQRAAAVLLLLALGVYLSLLNQAPQSPYFAQTLQEWELGKFIRFHGLAQWLGWIWPYAALAHVMSELWRPTGEN
jgi:VanZ family protein